MVCYTVKEHVTVMSIQNMWVRTKIQNQLTAVTAKRNNHICVLPQRGNAIDSIDKDIARDNFPTSQWETISEDTAMVEVTVSIPTAGNSLVVPQFVSSDLVGRSRMMTERAPMQMTLICPL